MIGELRSRGMFLVTAVGVLLVAALITSTVKADRFDSTNYVIDASVSNSFGGATSSASYKMESSGGEAIIGDGKAGSYKLGQGYIAQLEKSLQLSVLPSGLTSYYTLDAPEGKVAYDETTNSNKGALVGTPASTVGKLGNTFTFNGTDQRIDIAHGASNNLETYTVSAWIKTSQAPTGTVAIVEKYDGVATTYPYALRLNSTGTVQVAASDGTNSPVADSGTAVNDGAWHHVVAVRTKGADLKIFVDGVLKATSTDTTTVATTNTSGVGIAGRSNSSGYFSGQIDEVKIFDRAFTDKEAANEYAAQNAGIRSSLTFATLDAASSEKVGSSAIIQTDAPGYTIALAQDKDMTSGTNTIPAITGSIATPVAWDEGTTKGLGFTITGGSGVPAKWGTSPNFNYAAIPGTSTSFFTRSGYTASVKDVISLEHRVDISASQPVGDYKNTVTYSATMTP